MPLKLSDRVRENTATVGSGILSLVGNTDGFRRFNDVLASGDATYYCIEENDKFEIGVGTYFNNTLSRDYILQSTQSGSKINLGGSGVVFLTYPADKAVYKNQESEVVIGPSGIRFFDNTIQKTAAVSSSVQELVYISGIAIYSSGQSIFNEADIVSVSGWAKNYIDSQEYSSTAVSGWADITFLKETSNPFTYISGIAVYASGNVGTGGGGGGSGGVDLYTSGIATYASGQSIVNQNNIGNLNSNLAYVSGLAVLAEESIDVAYVSGIAVYASGKIYNDTYVSGIAAYASGQTISNQSSISNINNDLVYVSGLAVSAEESLDIAYISGIAAYSSGKIYNDIYLSGIATYASGQTISNQSQINSVSGWADTSFLRENSNPFVYISGLVVAAEESLDINYISGIAVYVSGNALYDLVEDTSPQLGGNLYTNSFNVSGVGNIIGSTGIFSSLKVNNIDVSVSGHTHVANDIVDFDTAVSGLLPVKNIIGGNNISVSSFNGEYSISASGLIVGTAESLVTTVFNKTGSPMPKMTAVYIDGGQGDLPTIQKARATADISSAGTYGLTYEAIGNMATGRVIVIGALNGLNTDQFNPTAPHGDVNGAVLYLSPTTYGGLTTTKPYAPNHVVTMGTIVRTHQTQGVIEVRVQNGYELEELHNVAITGVNNGEFLQYNSASGLWLASNSGYFSNLHLGPNGLRFNDGTHQITSGLPYGSGNLIDKNKSDIIYLSGLVVNAEETLEINYISGIARYASGETISNKTAITKNTNDIFYLSGLVVAAEESDSINYISGVANYSSGQSIQNQQQVLATSGWVIDTFSTINHLNYVSGIAIYSSGKSIQNTSDIIYLSGLVINAEESNDLSYVSGIAVYTSGKIYNDTYLSGISVYSSGQSIENEIQINAVSGWADASFLRENSSPFIYLSGLVVSAEESTDINYISGIAIYSSGQSIDNQQQITSVSGWATNTFATNNNLVYVSGISNYASGQSLTNQSNIASLNDNLVYISGLAVLAEESLDINYVSGIAAYSSGRVINNENSIIATSGWVNSTFATNIDLQYISGVAVYSSGQSVENQNQITSVSGWADTSFLRDTSTPFVYLSGLVVNAEESLDITYISGIAIYTSGKIYNDTYLSGIATYASGQSILNQTQINAISGWADSSFLKENSNPFIYLSGLVVAAEESNDITYVSGISVYSSGQVINNQQEILSVSGWTKNYIDSQDHTGIATSGWATNTFSTINSLNYVSGIANYASGQAISNKSDIITLNSDLIYISGLAIIAEESLDINYVSGIATYASGKALNNEVSILATSGWSDSAFATKNNLAYVSGISVYASGQSVNNQNQIVAVSGWTNSTFLKDTSAPFIYLSGLVVAAEESSEISYVSGIAVYSSGLSIQNQTDIIAVSGLITGSNVSITNPANNRILTSDGTSTGINAESNLIFDGTNLGIGTLPSHALDVYRSGTTTAAIVARNDNSTLLSYSTGTTSFVGTLTNTTLGFITNNSERMRITSDGNVGIGLTPSFKLDVYNGNIRSGYANNSALLVTANSTASTGAAIAIQQTTGEGWTAIFADFEPYAEWGFYHDNPNNRFDFTAGDSTNSLRSYSITNRTGNTATAYAKVSILQSSGDLLVGGSVGIGTSSPQTKLHVTGGLRLGDWTSFIFTDGNGRASWYGNAVTNTYLQSEAASRITQSVGNISFHTASAGTAGGAITWNHRFNLDDTGAAWIKTSRAWNDTVPTLSIGNDADGRLQTRHIWGKASASAAAEHLWLQHGNTNNHVQIGATGGGNNLYVVGNIYANGYFGGNLVLNAGNYNSYAPTLTGGGASGTWGINITGNSATVGSLSIHAGVNNEANKIVRTDGSGYLYTGWINTISGELGSPKPTRLYASTDAFIRYYPLATFKAHMGLTGKNVFSRAETTTDSNYWVGSMGWGNTNYNTVFGWGSGFTDVWDGPANQPPGTTHWQGIQALHYDNGVNSWGFQIACGAGNPDLLYIRGAWGGAPTSWRRIVTENNGSYGINITGTAAGETLGTVTGRGTTTNSIVQSNASVRAPIFYDSNDTNYYLDPNGTSNIVTLVTGNTVYSYNWFRSIGATGWFSETYGGGIWMTDSTYVRVYNNKIFYNDNSIQSANSMFAPIFYDWNNNAFYLDPNGSSRLSSMVIDGQTCNGWIDFPNYTGLRASALNNAHFYPNNASFGSWRIAGTRNGWAGIEFDSTGAGNVSLMMNSGRTGVHNNSYGWQWFWENGDFYISKSTFGGNTNIVKVLTNASDGNAIGSVKAFVSFNGQSNPASNVSTYIKHNVSIVYRTTTGEFQINFINRAPSVNYVVAATGTRNANIRNATFSKQTGYVAIEFRNESGVLMNPIFCDIAVFW